MPLPKHEYLFQTVRSTSVYYFLLACVVVLGFVIRLRGLGGDDLWIDEAFTGFLALTHDWLAYLRTDNTPPLYYLFMRAWCGVVSCNEFGLRLPSALAGGAFIIVLALVCQRMFGRTAALLVALATVLSPIHIYYSQEARVYSILLLALLVFLFLQWRVVHWRPTRASLALFFIVSTSVLYLHFLSMIIVATCLTVYLIERALGYRSIPSGYFLAVGAAILLFVPWVLVSILGERSSSSEVAWVTEYFSEKSSWKLPIRTLTTYLVGPVLRFGEINMFVKRYTFVDTPAFLHLINALLVFIFILLTILAPAKLPRPTAVSRAVFLELSSFIILPLGLLLVASLTIQPLYVVGRYDLIALPAFLLLAASVINRTIVSQGSSWKRVIATIVGVWIVLLLATQGYRSFEYATAKRYETDVKTSIAAATANLEDGDGLLIARPDAAQIWYYLHARGFDREGHRCFGEDKQFVCRLYPPEFEEAPASKERFQKLDDHDTQLPDVKYFLEALAANSTVILISERIATVDDNIQMDPIGAHIAARLDEAGLSVESSSVGRNIAVFRPH